MSFYSHNLSVIGYANGFTMWYYRTEDSFEKFNSPGYLDPAAGTLRTGDMVLVNVSDGAALFFINSDGTTVACHMMCRTPARPGPEPDLKEWVRSKQTGGQPPVHTYDSGGDQETKIFRPTHQHRKGGMYRVIARGYQESDQTPVVVYEGRNGAVWTRPADEFDDGRFTALREGEPIDKGGLSVRDTDAFLALVRIESPDYPYVIFSRERLISKSEALDKSGAPMDVIEQIVARMGHDIVEAMAHQATIQG